MDWGAPREGKKKRRDLAASSLEGVVATASWRQESVRRKPTGELVEDGKKGGEGGIRKKGGERRTIKKNPRVNPIFPQKRTKAHHTRTKGVAVPGSSRTKGSEGKGKENTKVAKLKEGRK